MAWTTRPHARLANACGWPSKPKTGNEVHPDLTVTVCIGVAHNGEADIKGGPTALVMLADNRLYAAKQAGRNRVNDSGHSAAATDVATRKSA